ncbi:MAG TPA: S9 family peptidase [Verrucomicrobiae bacterium]|nr:S9 family peptidase [Verrucomicrobiae bacterium]
MKTLIAACALLCCANVAAAPRPFTAQDLVGLERIADPRISPDGRYVAFQLREADVAANKGIHGLWFIDLSQKKPVPSRLTAAGVESNTARWSGNRLYFLSTRSGSQQLWRLDLGGGEAQRVSELPLDVGAYRVAPDGKRIALALEVFPDCATLACTRSRLDERAASKARGQVHDRLFVRHWDTWKSGTRSQLFIADLDGDGRIRDEPRPLTGAIDGDVPTKPFGGDEDFIFTPDGRALVFVARIAGATEAWSTNTDLWRVPADGLGEPQNLTPGNPGYDVGPAISPDGKTLAWRSMRRAGFEADRYRLMLRELSTGSVREVAADWDRSATAMAWAADGRSLYAAAEDVGNRRLFSINLKTGKASAISGPGSVSEFDVGAHVLVYGRDDLRSPTQLFLTGPQGGKTTPLTRANEARLAELELGAYEQFSFAGANGDTVHGYVTKPASFVKGRKYPVAFLIHGGPQTSFGNHWHYRWNPQTYAGAGYATVFIDFHGSDGYGQAFTDSISGDWGGKPLEDLRKGWAYALSKYAWLDGGRACALGASYGGYMVNWIAGNWSDNFKCLVSHDGVFDQRAMGYTTEELWFTEWENGGTPFEHPEKFEKWNPVNHVAKWKTPMLVIQGGLDYRIPDTQGIAAFTALQRRGIDSRFLYFPNENHWVLKPQNSLQWHQTVEEWLGRWIGS